MAATFHHGRSGIVDCATILNSTSPRLYAQLADPVFFAQVKLELGALTWPNGADLNPGGSMMSLETRKCGPSLFSEFVKTLQSHRSGICAYADHPITTARLEAGNVAIGLLRRRARGFRDTKYLTLKIYQLNTPDMPSFLYANVPERRQGNRLDNV